MKRTAATLLLLPLVTAACGTPLILAGVGAAIGVWTYDELHENSGEMIVHADAERTFATAIAVANSRPNASEIESQQSILRVTWKEGAMIVGVQVLLMPKTPEFSTLKVYAEENKVRGRDEVAREIAEQIAGRL